MFSNKVILLALCICILTGCTSMGTFIISNPNTYLSEAEFIPVEPKEIGFEQKEICSSNNEVCMPYLFAQPYEVKDFPDGKSVYYNIHAEGDGIENNIFHRMTPDTFNRIKGTAVIIHGYGGAKETMMATAIYFRAIGMKVVLPDLFGHGDSKEEFVFATSEHELLSKLLNKLNTNEELIEPVVIVGHSMGALPSLNLLIESNKVNGAILLAPMMRFDLAAKKYLPYKAPFLSKVFSGSLDNIVEQSMKDTNVVLTDTDILSKASLIKKPVLVVNSDVDSVSPPEYFSSLESDFITLEVFKGRNHSSLMVFSKEDASLIEKWLKEEVHSQLN